ncbi:hypothetical protein CJU90_6183 [Yarrowia sp. C11]|nr:hypothetical protein CJU90_6183 [Yarrowia sp. C11]KAG5370891.1 hypothetical protein CKK34_1023 [Yarrowia sp. E02]
MESAEFYPEYNTLNSHESFPDWEEDLPVTEFNQKNLSEYTRFQNRKFEAETAEWERHLRAFHNTPTSSPTYLYFCMMISFTMLVGLRSYLGIALGLLEVAIVYIVARYQL